MGDLLLKKTTFQHFFLDQWENQRFINEYSIMKLAREKECKHLVHLEKVLIGVDHVGLLMKNYEMTLREYLDS